MVVFGGSSGGGVPARACRVGARRPCPDHAQTRPGGGSSSQPGLPRSWLRCGPFPHPPHTPSPPSLKGTGKESGDRHPKIGDYVLIGASATVLGNIRVGEGAQIAAGSLVLKEVPPHTMVAGSPAKEVGKITGEGWEEGVLRRGVGMRRRGCGCRHPTLLMPGGGGAPSCSGRIPGAQVILTSKHHTHLVAGLPSILMDQWSECCPRVVAEVRERFECSMLGAGCGCGLGWTFWGGGFHSQGQATAMGVPEAPMLPKGSFTPQHCQLPPSQQQAVDALTRPGGVDDFVI